MGGGLKVERRIRLWTLLLIFVNNEREVCSITEKTEKLRILDFQNIVIFGGTLAAEFWQSCFNKYYNLVN